MIGAEAVDTTSMGVFVTASTSEMDIIDNKLAVAVEVLLRMLLSLLQVVVLGSLSTWGLFAAVVALVGLAVLLLARWFGRSSIELARSLSACKSPVVARILEASLAWRPRAVVLTFFPYRKSSPWSAFAALACRSSGATRSRAEPGPSLRSISPARPATAGSTCG